MKVKGIRNIKLGAGVKLRAGEVVELSADDAAFFIRRGAAVAVTAEAEPEVTGRVRGRGKADKE